MNTNLSDIQEPFRLAMRRMAATPSIITTSWEGTAYGMAASSITAVSMSPPSLLVAINTGASIHDPLLKAGSFWINMLGDVHQNELSVFSGKLKGAERFLHGRWADQQDIPRLEDAQANLRCQIEKAVPFATHTIVVGTVTEALTHECINPLIYLDGKTWGLPELSMK